MITCTEWSGKYFWNVLVASHSLNFSKWFSDTFRTVSKYSVIESEDQKIWKKKLQKQNQKNWNWNQKIWKKKLKKYQNILELKCIRKLLAVPNISLESWKYIKVAKESYHMCKSGTHEYVTRYSVLDWSMSYEIRFFYMISLYPSFFLIFLSFWNCSFRHFFAISTAPECLYPDHE